MAEENAIRRRICVVSRIRTPNTVSSRRIRDPPSRRFPPMLRFGVTCLRQSTAGQAYRGGQAVILRLICLRKAPAWRAQPPLQSMAMYHECIYMHHSLEQARREKGSRLNIQRPEPLVIG